MSAIIGSSKDMPVFGLVDNANRIPIEIDDALDVVKMRARFRNDDFAKIWLKTSCGIRFFYLGWNESKTALRPILEQASNYRKSI